jgi:ssDNA-binding Zn-finger/Zn-ribbon topoisomerase 1
VLQMLNEVPAPLRIELERLLEPGRKMCPKCESPMVLRTARKGAKAGQEFWGCSNYPKCRYVLRG